MTNTPTPLSAWDQFVKNYALTYVMEAAFRVWLVVRGYDINSLEYDRLTQLYYSFKQK